MVKTLIQVYNDSENGLGFTAFLRACEGLYIYCKDRNLELEVTYKNSCLESFLKSHWNEPFSDYKLISSICELDEYLKENKDDYVYVYCSGDIESYNLQPSSYNEIINKYLKISRKEAQFLYQEAYKNPTYVYNHICTLLETGFLENTDINNIQLDELKKYIFNVINIKLNETKEFILNKCLVKTPYFHKIYENIVQELKLYSHPYIVLYIRTPDKNLDDENFPITISENSDIVTFLEFVKKKLLLETVIVVSTSYKIKKELQEKFNIRITPTIPVRLHEQILKIKNICPSNGIIDFFILMEATVVVSIPIEKFHGGYAQTAYKLQGMKYYESLEEFQEDF